MSIVETYAAMGPRKIAYADIKLRKEPALARIFHGTSAQQMMAVSSWPRRMLTKRGINAIRSLAADSELAEILTPKAARAKEKAAKNRAARLSQWATRAMGSHSTTPYRTPPAEDEAMPIKAMNVKKIGSIGTYMHCHLTETRE